jgi:UDP-2-acetamido-2,6-beta-L-arabino-hexul-4-ose reductase
LKNIRDNNDRTRSNLTIEEIYEYGIDSAIKDLDSYCASYSFVFNLAGVNRHKENSEFMAGNFGFASTLLDTLRKHHNTCPVMLSSSIQATLIGRHANSDYSKSKFAGEELFFDYSKKAGANVLVYRFPNLFGKWCRPNYNSAVATFCNNMANDLPKLSAIEQDHGRYCFVPITYHEILGEIVNLLEEFKKQPSTLMMPSIPNGSFNKKLYSTYLSYLPKEKISFPLNMNIDNRGSFTELMKTESNGQFSVNISKPGMTKCQHWHNSKWEFFIVVAGHGLIEERKIGTEEVLKFEVSGEKIEAVHMLPGYTHNIINLSDTEDLVTVMWANESFDVKKPDTFGQLV